MPSMAAVKEIMRFHLSRRNINTDSLDLHTEKCYKELKKNWGKRKDWSLEVYLYSEKIKTKE
jgi:hypothetical protein